jgi:TATA-box binding protein (TBP) (component of TFIID and TFIIIB)
LPSIKQLGLSLYALPKKKMDDAIISFDAECNVAMDIAKNESNILKFSDYPFVFTGTYCFYTSFSTLNVIKLSDIFTVARTLHFKNCYVSKHRYFRNSLLLKINGLGVKLFTNGTIHITGAKKCEAAYKVVVIILEALGKVRKDEQYIVKSFTPQMINISFKLSKQLNLDALSNTKAEKKSVCYDKNKHAALKIKIMNNVNILLFSSGSVLLMGNKSAKDIKETIEWVANFIV